MRRSSKVLWLGYLLLIVALLGLVFPISSLVTAHQTPTGIARIVFVTNDMDTHTMTISTADSDGQHVTTLVNEGIFANPIWSPNGRYLAFVGKVHNWDKLNLYVMDSDGANLRAVVEASGSKTLQPSFAAWSPDSTQLIYGAFGPSGIDGFYKVNVDGSGQEQLEFEGIPDDFIDTWVAWSPDGSQIAVHAKGHHSTYGQLYVTDADGSNARPFVATTASANSFSYLAWSPDGQQVVLNVTPGIGSMEPEAMAIANADGSNIQILVDSPPDFISSTSWSPDGSQIVFVANEPNVESSPGGELWTVNADGSNIRALHIAANVANLGTSWGLIPTDLVPPSVPISFANGIQFGRR